MKRLLLIVYSCSILFGCATQRVVPKKDLNTALTPDKDKWMVLCLSPVDEFRTSLENQLQNELKFHEVHSQTSHQHLPQSLTANKNTEKKLISFMDSLEEKEFSMLLLSSLESKESVQTDEEGFFGDFTLYHFVTSLYALDDKELSLEWSMCLCIYEYQMPQISIEDFARAIVWKLAEDDMIPNHKFRPLEFYTLLK